MTLGEAKGKLEKAVDFLHRIGRSEDAARVESMSPEEYATEKGAELIENPRRVSLRDRRNANMPGTKRQLQADLDEISELVDDALDPELSREELVAKVKEIAAGGRR